ncbi:MAG: Flp pilus assembly protein CpaB [Armatimonadota bacterium]
MRLTRRQAFAVAAIIAVVVAGLVYFVLSRETAPEESIEAQTVNVLVATQDISPFTTITPEMLESNEMDTRAAPAGALNAPEQAIGKVSQSSIIRGQTITSSDVGPRSAQQGLTFAIPEGLRAVTVALDPISGVGGFVFPGDRVDVLSTFQQGEVAVTRTILQNVEVLAMNEQTTRPAATGTAAAQTTGQTTDEGAQEQDGGDAPATVQVKSATLAVTPDQAQSLLLSAFKGAVHLALRPREEGTVVSLASQTDWALMGMEAPSDEPAEEPEPEADPEQQPVGPNGWPPMYGPTPQQQAQPEPQPQPQAQPEPEPAPTVEVFRGNEREVIEVD